METLSPVHNIISIPATHPALQAHLSGPLARKAARATTPAKRVRYRSALVRVLAAAEQPPKAPSTAPDSSGPGPSLSSSWTVETARVAFSRLESSGQSRAAFAKSNGFHPSRFNRWSGRLAEVSPAS